MATKRRTASLTDFFWLGWRRLSSEKIEYCLQNHSDDFVENTASYILYKSTAFKCGDVQESFFFKKQKKKPPSSSDSVWLQQNGIYTRTMQLGSDQLGSK